MVAYEFDDQTREKRKQTLYNEIIPFYLLTFTHVAKDNGGHLALNRTTWADVYFAGIIDYCCYLMEANLLENYPVLQKIVDDITSHPNVKAYIDRRPETDC